MALLVQWLSQAEEIPLVEEDYSFHDLALDWMEDLWDDEEDDRRARAPDAADDDGPAGMSDRRTPQERWALARKFLDYLEANAEELWEVPRFELADDEAGGNATEDDEDDDIYGAAYEGVTYRDSTDDDFEGEMLEGDGGDRAVRPPTSSWWARPSGSSVG